MLWRPNSDRILWNLWWMASAVCDPFILSTQNWSSKKCAVTPTNALIFLSVQIQCGRNILDRWELRNQLSFYNRAQVVPRLAKNWHKNLCLINSEGLNLSDPEHVNVAQIGEAGNGDFTIHLLFPQTWWGTEFKQKSSAKLLFEFFAYTDSLSKGKDLAASVAGSLWRNLQRKLALLFVHIWKHCLSQAIRNQLSSLKRLFRSK